MVKINTFDKNVIKTADNWWKWCCMWQIRTFLWFWGFVYCHFTLLDTTSCPNHTIFHFFYFSGYVSSQNCFLEEILKWNFFIVAEADAFLYDIFPTSNGQTLKSFNLKGKSWENKILRMAEVCENIQFWQKINKTADKLIKMALHVTNYDFSMVLRAFILLFDFIRY